MSVASADQIFAAIRATTAAERIEWRRRAAHEAFRLYPHVEGSDCAERMCEYLAGKREGDHLCTCPNAAEREEWLRGILQRMGLDKRANYLSDLQEALRLLRRRWNKKDNA